MLQWLLSALKKNPLPGLPRPPKFWPLLPTLVSGWVTLSPKASDTLEYSQFFFGMCCCLCLFLANSVSSFRFQLSHHFLTTLCEASCAVTPVNSHSSPVLPPLSCPPPSSHMPLDRPTKPSHNRNGMLEQYSTVET